MGRTAEQNYGEEAVTVRMSGKVKLDHLDRTPIGQSKCRIGFPVVPLIQCPATAGSALVSSHRRLRPHPSGSVSISVHQGLMPVPCPPQGNKTLPPHSLSLHLQEPITPHSLLFTPRPAIPPWPVAASSTPPQKQRDLPIPFPGPTDGSRMLRNGHQDLARPAARSLRSPCGPGSHPVPGPGLRLAPARLPFLTARLKLALE